MSAAREFDGCLHVAITADSVDPERINTIEVWREAEALKQWRKQANAPRLGKPNYLSAQRYDVTDGGIDTVPAIKLPKTACGYNPTSW